MKPIIILTSLQLSFSNFILSNVNNIPVCLNKISLTLPPFVDPIKINKLTWSINNPPLIEQISINGNQPIANEILCMAGCVDPPCYPLNLCNQNDLWWSFSYNNLIIEPNSIITLSDLNSPPPMQMGILFDFYTFPSSTPLPSITPSLTPQPTLTPSLSPSVSLTPGPTPILIPTFSNSSNIQLSSDYYNTCTQLNPSVLTLSVLFSITFVICISTIIFSRYKINTEFKCPYCYEIYNKTSIQLHLKECSKHLELFNIIKIDGVTEITNQQNIEHQDVSVSTQTDRLIFPKKENILINYKTETIISPELIGSIELDNKIENEN